MQYAKVTALCAQLAYLSFSGIPDTTNRFSAKICPEGAADEATSGARDWFAILLLLMGEICVILCKIMIKENYLVVN